MGSDQPTKPRRGRKTYIPALLFLLGLGAEVASYTLQLQALLSGLGGLDHPHWQDSGGPTAFLTGTSHTVPKPPGGGRFHVRMRAVSTGDAAGEWQESEWSAPSNELTV